MPLAYPFFENQISQVFLSQEEIASLIYHDIFEYPLDFADIVKWRVGEKCQMPDGKRQIANKNGYFYLGDREGLIYKRLLRKRISTKKLAIAKRGAKIISLIPTVKMIAVTGALAMENASDESDIDLMIITRKGTLWTTRAFAYLLTCLLGIKLRRPGDVRQKDKLCLNMWLDEQDLVWLSQKRNIYTAHEIAQVRPLVNRDQTYEKFMAKNNWIREYWPNAVRVTKLQSYKVKERNFLYSVTLSLCNLVTSFFEKLAFKSQYQYMKAKISREVVTPTRALFHPVDWGKTVLSRLNF